MKEGLSKNFIFNEFYILNCKLRFTKNLWRYIMELEYNQRYYSYPSIIKGLIHEVSKKDFDYFQIVYANDNFDEFHKDDKTLIEFREDHIKKTDENGDVTYWNYSNICRIFVSKTQGLEEDEDIDVFDDDDLWTGNRIQF